MTSIEPTGQNVDIDPGPALPAQVPLSEEDRRELARYLETEVADHTHARQDRLKKLKDLNEQYKAPRARFEKNFPHKRASQIRIPIGKMAVNVIAPRLIDELVRALPVWSVRSSHKASVLERVANEGEDFMHQYAERRMEIEEKIELMVLEGTKFGLHAFEISMDQLRRQTARYTEDGIGIELTDRAGSIGPAWKPIPQEDFVWKFGYTNVQEMPWVGCILHLSGREIIDRGHSGVFVGEEEIAKVIGRPFSLQTQEQNRQISKQQEEFERTKPSIYTPALFDIYQLYVYWPIKIQRKRVFADLLVHYHYDSRTILSVRLNPWWHGKRPILTWTYQPVEYRLDGEGVLEQSQQFEDEITTLHRLRIDNQTLASMSMVVISKMVEGIGPGEPLYPGKVIKAQNVADVQPFKLADPYPTTVLGENTTMAFAERVTGINEATLGRALPVTRTTATAQVSLLEESSKRFNMTIRRARRVVGKAGELTYDLFNQFGTGGLAEEWLGPARGQIVELLFSVPRERVIKGFSIGVVATSPKVNKQLDMQANLQLFNLMVQLHTQLLQMVASLGPQFAQQVLPLVARGLVSSAKRFMTRVLDAFDEQDPEGVLQALAILELILPDPSAAFGRRMDEQTLREAIAELRPELAGAMEQAVRAGTSDALATAAAAGGNGAPSTQGFEALARLNPLAQG